MKTVYPTISVVIPTFNEERNIEQCLKSVFTQKYPKDKLEVFIVDDSSTDKTLDIAQKFPVKIIHHSAHDPEVAKKIAFEKSRGEFFVYFDADLHLKGKDWFTKMVQPLIEDSSITATFTRYNSDNHSTNIERYLNLDPLQRDPIYQFFSPRLEDLVEKKRSNYHILKYYRNKIPPAGLCLHRRDLIKPFLKNKKRFLELDLLVDLVSTGNDMFAYVPDAGLFHHHATTLSNLLYKRSRNVTRVYLKDNTSRKYRWFDLKSVKGFLKVVFWILLSHSILPFLGIGFYKSIRHKTWVGLYEPVVSILTTDVIIYSFLSDTRSWDLLKWKKA